MKKIVSRSIVLMLLLALVISISACGSKKPTAETPGLPTDIPAEVIVNTPSVVLLRNFDCSAVTDVSQTECQALVVFYNAANGDGWLNKSGWLENNDLSTWYGVTIKDGHVYSLNVSKNQLTGSLPSNLGDLANLIFLNVSENQLTGQIPLELASLTNLRSLILSFNNFSGTIPSSLGQLSKLTSLYLSSNRLEGNVPTEISNLVNLKTLQMHNNQLSGSLPISLNKLISMQNFSFFGTSLCEPPTSDFQSWKSSVEKWYGNGSVCQ